MKPFLIIADDEFVNRLIIRKMISAEWFDIVETDNGKKTIDAVEKNIDRFIILLLDLNMPVTDGYFVLNELKKDIYQSKPIKTIVITGSDFQELVKRGFDNLIHGFVQKPISQQDLLVKINKVMEGISG